MSDTSSATYWKQQFAESEKQVRLARQANRDVMNNTFDAAIALLKTNGLDPRNTDTQEHPTFIVGTKELAVLFDLLTLPQRHELYAHE